jgi:hypothetical protein
MKKEKETEIIDGTTLNLEAIQETADASQGLIPHMNVNMPAVQEDQKPLIEDEKLVGVLDEVLSNIRQDRLDIDGLLSEFTEMVINGGDATTSSKEAVVNLLKIKTDTSDKMSKVVEQMIRIKFKDGNTFPKYLAAHQNNTINIAASKKTLSSEEKRAIIENANNKFKKEII